ncbi:hypothetical protein [Butyrivibrio sp. XBB1001]|uniref:hypothetical protein n=1 Tax=Butyrivibrio sp. XBB1001 TaxID=1280682 RepID=UPI0003F9C57A|nr:hypothetical protein [Butyrivibrio sp. XBB1001]
MKTKVLLGVLLGTLALSACSFSEVNESNKLTADQAAEEASQEAEDTETARQKLYEYKLLYAFKDVAEETFPDKIQRGLYWEENDCADNTIGIVSVPILDENGMQDMTKFCGDICDWIESSLKEVSYEEAPWLYQEILIYMYPDTVTFNLAQYISNGYDREILYGGLYDFVDKELTRPKNVENSQAEENSEGQAEDFSSYSQGCTYKTQDGITYELVATDRAAGSSYYVLISYKEGRNSVALVNRDPFNGSGGEAKWITFIDDTELGFACLSYNGGDDAFLYRTDDGGRSFTQINFPSARVTLADGSIYNPFVIPKKVWAEDGDLFMLVGQSAWSGDYYSEELGKHPSGLYVSHDNGISFEYVGEQ